MKSTKKIICFLIVFAMLESKVFSTPEIDWYERYEYNSEVIRELIEEKEKEQIEVNVEPQRTSFDIVIFMGGTNMVGKGTSSEAVEGIDGAGYEMQFTTQNGEPYGVSKIAEPFGDTNGSMVTAFMNSYYLNTGVPVIGIPASVDGSSIYSTWQEGQVGLENAKNKYEKTYRWMQENGYKVRHSYMIWNQGEADVENIEGFLLRTGPAPALGRFAGLWGQHGFLPRLYLLPQRHRRPLLFAALFWLRLFIRNISPNSSFLEKIFLPPPEGGGV